MRKHLIGMPADRICGESPAQYAARKDRIQADANKAAAASRVGDKIKFKEERLAYTVQARGERYLVCTKPFNPRRTVLYTIVDIEQQIRGTENIIFGIGAETVEQCQDMLLRLEGKDGELGFQSEVSHRNQIRLLVDRVIHARGEAA